MASTTGEISIDLNTIGATVNQGTRLGHNVTGGVADQGDLIGLGIGLGIALGLLLSIIFIPLGVVIALLFWMTKLRKTGRMVSNGNKFMGNGSS